VKPGWSLIGGIGLGAGLMYLLDPDRGRRRRARLCDQAVHTWHRTNRGTVSLARDVGNRARGLVAKARQRLTCEEVSDELLVERVRARLGHVVSNPRSITVTAREGHVTLSGPVLTREAARLLAAVSSVAAVTSVEDQLERHERAEGVPGLEPSRPVS
jgi:osmotically-inducible protein OsmY